MPPAEERSAEKALGRRAAKAVAEPDQASGATGGVDLVATLRAMPAARWLVTSGASPGCFRHPEMRASRDDPPLGHAVVPSEELVEQRPELAAECFGGGELVPGENLPVGPAAQGDGFRRKARDQDEHLRPRR